MKSRPRLLLMLAALLAITAFASAWISLRSTALSDTPSGKPTRPNILLLLTDDHRWDMIGCAGNSIIQTPNIDALAQTGTRFRNMFVTTAICAASRASILTGLHERTHQFTFNTAPLSEAHADLSYPALLKQAGYRTGFVGKFGVLTHPGTTERMFDSFVPTSHIPPFVKQPDGTDRHFTDLEADSAIAFLDTVRPNQPFCLSVSFNAPHAIDADPRQYVNPPELEALYRGTTFPVPKTMTDAFFDSQPDFLKNSEGRVRFRWRFDNPVKYQEMVRGYYRMITGVDRAIGRIREELARRGLAENTVILITGDNGYFLGDRGFADKWYIYEHSIRVPLIINDGRPGRSRRGAVLDQTVLNIDLAPTLLELAGLTIPKTIQGHGLVPLIEGRPTPGWRTDFFYEHLFDHPRIPKSEGVRTDRWTYVRWFEQKPVFEELYDHEADFDETHNLATDPRHAHLVTTLRTRTTELRDLYGGPYRPIASKPVPTISTKPKLHDSPLSPGSAAARKG